MATFPGNISSDPNICLKAFTGAPEEIAGEEYSRLTDRFSKDSKITMDIVITVCGNARDEECPYWPGNPIRVHWGVPDPANVTGSNSEKQIGSQPDALGKW